MKLPDFRAFAPLNDLKSRMGIPVDVYGLFTTTVEAGRLTVAELDALTSGEGVEVIFDQLTVLEDGTLAYKDSRVLLYIRDIHFYGRQMSEPRYHFSNCSTLQAMNEKGRFERYVIATEINGIFKVNIISNGRAKSERRPLSVCQNCLSNLSFEGFNLQLDRRTRKRKVSEFALDRFFLKYPRSLHMRKPAYDSDSAPLNNYTSDWQEISARVRKEAHWTCQACKRVLIGDLRRYLDVHHVDGNRSNNNRKNLKVLCVACHATEPNHHHLKNDRRFTSYQRIRLSAP
jgi:5-methylcytosine-specific restriction endonuclease McrA